MVQKLLVSFSQEIQNLQNGRKRPIEVLNHDQIPLNEWKKNKRMKLSHQITEEIKDCSKVWNLQLSNQNQ